MIRARAIGGDVFIDHDGTTTLFWRCSNPILAPFLVNQVNDLIDRVFRANRVQAAPSPPLAAAEAAVGPYDYDPDEWLGPEGDE